MKYRAEIDGLRALALLPVILLHAGFEWFSGGFVGVDVFFVISGYLITTIIISELADGQFSIINFYERRARRILPALFFVMAACLPFAWLWLTPADLRDFGESLVAVSTFSSNILFWWESDYFDAASELKPLLHTWSLAVEEQYYILFPIFLMLTWRLGIKWVLILLSAVFVISLGVAAFIIVMSVINGFRIDLTNRIIGLNSHLNIYSFDNEITNKQADELILNIDNSFFYQHYKSIETNGLIIKSNNSKGVMIKGYDEYDKNHYLFNSINMGALIQNPKSEILIGDSLANEMNLSVGDKVKIAIPKTDKTILGNIPRFKTLEVVGVFDLGLYEYDSNLIFLSSELVRKLLLYDEDIYNKIEFFTSSPNEIELFKNKVELETSNLLLNFYSISWKDQNKTLINALKVEKNVMFIILSLIILVASLNIISGLIIFVKEKNKDIGILKTIGMSNKSIIKIFFTIGISIGLIGSLIGLIIGILFTINIKSIQSFLEYLLGTKLFSEEVYYLSSLPSKISINEVVYVLCVAIIISIISTIFPALSSARIDPIKSLRSE